MENKNFKVMHQPSAPTQKSRGSNIFSQIKKTGSNKSSFKDVKEKKEERPSNASQADFDI